MSIMSCVAFDVIEMFMLSFGLFRRRKPVIYDLTAFFFSVKATLCFVLLGAVNPKLESQKRLITQVKEPHHVCKTRASVWLEAKF